MEDIQSFIESGILESYVIGNSSSHESDLVEKMATSFLEVRAELELINEALEFYVMANAVVPDPLVRPFLMATIDFTERMKSGEQPGFPPELNAQSKIADFSEWLNRADMVTPANLKDLHAKIIGYTPTVITAIVWVKDMAPQEVHDNEYEKFLIIEGTCNITVGDTFYSLVPGDYFSIPLHEQHQVIVTSLNPCKVILQRIAA